MLSATLTSMVLTSYETSLAACTALTAFIPMLTGTGGNSGTHHPAPCGSCQRL